MGAEGRVRKPGAQSGAGRGDRTTAGARGGLGSRPHTRPRALEMVLKRVYTLLSSWSRLEDFDQIFWGQKSDLAGQWFPQVSIRPRWPRWVTRPSHPIVPLTPQTLSAGQVTEASRVTSQGPQTGWSRA